MLMHSQYIYIYIYISFLKLFYTYFWIVNDGQTLGMQAWKIKLISDEKLTPRVCLLRCAFSTFSFLLFGLGYFLIIFRKDKKSLADLVTKTRIIRIK